ncbi:DNA/RNA non-specific endonuclease [Mucilaginibacter jinjuensis]|uniref:DNA/RNA non-specific endonuclease n=1 Tax=Mucilaginibacter jinjuensis TaxID=1176721 RepID=A0ABY7TA31_9SPHI|nr:DNA/RNA non-specific endonuclease [Mucilaginibacter jinjuensis]WCT13370.1 DNA/RNA non-specific endonuclease [Mucilaginibacter jinjuensis]
MNKIKLTMFGCIVFLAACSKKNDTAPTYPNSPATPPKTQDTVYKITEDFEKGTKGGYAIANVNLKTGAWSLDDALIANTGSDSRIDNWSVRLRTGNITSNFKVSGLKMVYVSSATYGNDAASTWQFQTSTDGTTFTQVGSLVTDNSKTFRLDSFAVSSTAPVAIRIVKTGTTRVNIDNIIFRGTGKSGIVIDTTSTTPPPTGGGTGTVPPAGAGRLVTAGVDAPPVSGDNSNLLLGNPSNADSTLASKDNYLIDQHYYIESYSATRGTPNWTAWHLDKTNLGNTDRLDNFAAWAGIPSNWFQVGSDAYSGTEYNRGHNCPSGDRTSSTNANSATFLMTNMIPQTSANNGGTWGGFEAYVRGFVQNNNMEAYIIMGSYGTKETIDGGHVTVPTNVWKVVVLLPVGNGDISRIDANTRIIAIDTPNTDDVLPDWTKYITTVKSIENATGYNLLSTINAQLRATLETKMDSGS